MSGGGGGELAAADTQRRALSEGSTHCSAVSSSALCPHTQNTCPTRMTYIPGCVLVFWGLVSAYCIGPPVRTWCSARLCPGASRTTERATAATRSNAAALDASSDSSPVPPSSCGTARVLPRSLSPNRRARLLNHSDMARRGRAPLYTEQPEMPWMETGKSENCNEFWQKCHSLVSK